jgi:hypothetical protein
MRSLSVLQNARKSDVKQTPFPHIVLDHALPAEIYAELVRTFPPLIFMGIFKNSNNRRWNYAHRQARRNFLISRLWRDFLAYHSSQEFFNEVRELFYDGFHTLYPDRYPSLEAVRATRAGARSIDDFKSKDILLEAMISGNTPVTQASSVRTTHVDAGDKLYSGLL